MDKIKRHWLTGEAIPTKPSHDDLLRAKALRGPESDFVIPQSFILAPAKFKGMQPVIDQLILRGTKPKGL